MVAASSHDEQVSTLPRVRVQLSAPIEILFALYFLGKLGQRHPDARFFLEEQAPELARRARDFWPDAPGDFTESVVFAWASGTLFGDDSTEFLDRLEATAAADFQVPDFPGEDAEDAATIRRHILELRVDSHRRQNYVALLREVWAVLQPEGERKLMAGQRAATELTSRLASMPWREAIPDWAICWCTISEPLLDPAAERGELVVVPMYITDRGKFIFALPDVTLLGFVPGERPPDFKIARDTAEAIAARHKVVSDPTRLQLLGSLVKRGATVGELADMYELSQPTVSVHMKQLREAGLVRSVRDGAQVMYRTDAARLREILGDADLFAR